MRPFAIGAYGRFGRGRGYLSGGDIAVEGTVEDRTLDVRPPNDKLFYPTVTVNGLQGFGWSAKFDPRTRIDVALLIGIRYSHHGCGTARVRRGCGDGEEPMLHYGLNFGALALVSAKGPAVGLRVSRESAQLLLGFAF